MPFTKVSGNFAFDRIIFFYAVKGLFFELGLARWALPAQEHSDMSIRIIAQRLLQNGRVVLRSLRNNEQYYSGSYAKGQLDKIHVVPVGKPLSQLPQGSSNVTHARTHLAYLGAQARRLFVDNILRRVTNSLAGDLRRKAASRLLGGDSAPFFALVGVSLASGTGILTKDEELEGVCWEIREAVSKLQWMKPQNDQNYETNEVEKETVSLKDLVVGPPIAKGCSAVVYAARIKESSDNNSSEGPVITQSKDLSSFPLVVKMMFNYDAESNAMSIIRAMYRETVPARKYDRSELADWEQRMADNKRILPPHPNIVAMYHVFADRIPYLPGSSVMYPDALPTRLNPEGSGRNMSLFLLMKRYDTTLKQYMIDHPVNIQESILLFAQLLEGIAHMNIHEIAHRDLKSDNILLDVSEESENCPSLVISDFGCCLADKHHGLYLPYNSHDVDKGGNAALMAPEVVTAEPGPFTSINYTKADLWTAGTIAYEIFGAENPFYGGKNHKSATLRNYNYSDDELPALPENTPSIISSLVKNILSRNLYKRLTAEMAATVIQLYLWAPSSWLHKNKKPSSDEILQWLLCLTTKVLCEGREFEILQSTTTSDTSKQSQRNNYQRMISTRGNGRRTMPEYQLIANFLGRVSLYNVQEGLRWIYKNTVSQGA
ncbi:serine/threonine-protein kinase PINK1, mitochondrial [Chelonus insularis]|uniref:serine/threonine-protein kinase PINK1, mitochondrial n=1 Tax=Chelonus insularis TaxID=460826 RepID=UPI00158EEA82|nr:serine/threonine-protein kinase PINK1, mitochondrial [Chelonus insularis]